MAIHKLQTADNSDNRTLRARGRLSNAREWFSHHGWLSLPDGERGPRIRQWGADHAWLSSPDDPEGSVRRWIRCWDMVTDDELDEIVAYTRTSNKRWTDDQSAVVLGVTVADRHFHGFRFIGACDDDDGEKRAAINREKAAARARRLRAAKGAKRGRPPLQLSPEEALARLRAQDAERAKRYRASRKNASPHISKNIGSATELSVTVPVAATMPAVAGTTNQSIELAMVDRVAGDGSPNQQSKPLKTKFPTAMRLTREMKAYAAAVGFEPARIADMFELFRSWNISEPKRPKYSTDWTVDWFKWVDRQVTIDTEHHHRQRARAYFEHQRAA